MPRFINGPRNIGMMLSMCSGCPLLYVFHKTSQPFLVKTAKLRRSSCQICERDVYSFQGLGNVTDNDTENVTGSAARQEHINYVMKGRGKRT